MDVRDSMQDEIREVEQCTTRDVCPFGALCGVSRKGFGKPLFPVINKLGKGEIMWTSVRFESQVNVVRKGVFISIGTGDVEGESIPFALLGKGNTVGLAEAYTPQELSDYYHIRNLIEGEICSIPTKVVRRKLEDLPVAYAHKLMCCSFVSQTAASFTLTKILMRKSLYDRVLTLLFYLQDLTGRQAIERTTLEITHEEIATLVVSDRASVTRVLRKMADEGVVSIGYKSITLDNDIAAEQGKGIDCHNYFVMLKDEAEHLKTIDRLMPRIDSENEPYIML